MLNAFLWGLLATSSLVIGGLIASHFSLGKKSLGLIMAFGAGTLISAVSYELIYEAIKLSKGSYFAMYGFFSGALTYYFSDRLLENIGSRDHKKGKAALQSNLIIPMILAIILDGVPESIVIGLGIFEGGTVSMAMLAAVFISNMPEAIAGTTGMKSSGWDNGKITMLWIFIALVCAASTIAGFSFFSWLSNEWIAFIQAFAGGAILIMLANSMIPESYEHAGKLAGIFTIFGFFISLTEVFLEMAG